MITLEKGNIEDIIALTPIQEGMLFFYLKEPEKNYYFEQLSLRISGQIDMDCFEQAWNFVIETNEILRTVFRWEKLKNPTQVVLKDHTITLRYHDFFTKGIGEKRGRIEEIKTKDRKEKFDLREVPFRVTLCKVEEDKYEMIISNHHILYDGWSTGIILREFVTAYTDLFNKKNPVKPLKTKFKEFIRWNREQDRKNKEKAFWKDYLKDFDTPLEFSIKRKTGKEKESSSSESLQIRVDEDTRDKLERYVKKYKITVAALLYSGWGILLRKYNNNEDVIFGTTVSGRRAPIKGIEDMVGLFINTLPLRIRIENHPNEKILDLLYKINQTLQVREDYESSSLVNIKEYSDIGSRSHEELFDTVMVIENYPLDLQLKTKHALLSFDSYSIFERTHYDLTVGITLGDGDMVLNVYYQEELFDESAIERLSHHYISVIKNIIEDSGQAVSGIEIISPEERRKILVDFNTTDAEYPHNKTIHQLFEEQAARVGDSIAVIGMVHSAQRIADGEYMHTHKRTTDRETEHPELFYRCTAGNSMCYALTYRELNESANQLAHLLREKGVKPDGIVAIMVERSVEMVVGILAILKAGGAYMPIDPHYPNERKLYMLKDSNARILVSEVYKVRGVSEGIEVIDLNQLTNSPTHPFTHSPTQLSSGNLAYVIYTSGSTGQPKGVTIEHGSVVNLLWQLNEAYSFTKFDAYLLKTSYLFDVSVTELFGWFQYGGKLVILRKNDEKDPQRIVDAIEYSGITHINFVPSQFNVFVDQLNWENIDKISSLKYIFLAGEALLPELVHKFKASNINSHIQLENLYGPTEATVYASGYSLSQWNCITAIPIGKPLQNLRLYILDKDNHLLGVGIPGELCVIGVGVARGYLNNPELTAGKFGHDFQGYQDEKGLKKWRGKYSSTSLYRTGDLARWLPDGNIEFLGRIDQQVKIRGFRIELGEIENQLLNHNEVKEVVVMAKPDETGDYFLCAFIVPHSPDTFQSHRLRNYLLKKLPDYMIPVYFATLTEMPLTATGKIDRKSLPAPEITSTKEYIAPRNKREKLLVEIWSEVLAIAKDRVGIDDNFFELGGHSLKAIGLITRLNKVFDIEIPLSELFDSPTVRGLALYMGKEMDIHSHHEHIEPTEEKEYYELSLAQKRFFILQQIISESASYNMTETLLLEGKPDRERFEESFKKIVIRHESLRTSFHLIEGEPVQNIHQEVDFRLDYYETGIDEVVETFDKPFNLSKAPLLRVALLKVNEKKHFLLVSMHHIISDGTSTGIFIKDFLSFYKGEQLPSLRLQYKNYVQWQQKCMEARDGEGQEEPQSSTFEGEILNLPTDFLRPVEQDFEGNTLRFEVGPEETAELNRMALEEDVTLFMLLLAIYNVFLSKLSGQENILVGSPIAGRTHIDLENIIGLFINTLVFRNCPSGEKAFSLFLQEVKTHALEVFAKQDYIYEELMEKVGSTANNTGRNPLFDVMFVLQNMEIPEIEMAGLKVHRDVRDNKTSKFDITLYCEEEGEHLNFKFEYAIKLFKEETIRRFIRYFKKIVSEILEKPRKEIAEIEIISEEEKQQILYDFNDTSVTYPRHKTIHQVLEEQVEKAPHKTAVIWADRRVTYKKLNGEANRWARLLRDKGLRLVTIVGIMMERSIQMVIGIQAILKAGGAYVPIDPEYPENRIISMLENSGASLLLTDSKVVGKKSLPILSQQQDQEILLMPMDELTEELQKQPVENLDTISGPGDLIYIIFTSGSTGKPKGAGVYHRGFMNLMFWFVTEFELAEEDSNLFLTSLSFDLTQKNLYASLMKGGAICFPGVNYFEPVTLLREISRNRATWINCTPSMFYKLVEYEEGVGEKHLATLRYVFLGGEPISLTTLIDWLESDYHKAQIVNTYGPTECTDICASFRITEPWRFLEETIPVGDPVYNVLLYVLDRNLQIQPIGVPGELLIGGEGVGIGYVNDKELTSQKFIRHSFGSGEPERLLYRTGDLVKWLPDGNIEFIGRIDYQVKIRGYRIELGEIESLLLNCEDVKEAVVMAREGDGSDKYLCSYIVPYTLETFRVSQVREYLAAELPDYMVPSYFVILEKMPLNPNGKVDRKALPEPDVTASKDYVPPRNERETLLVNLWSDVLGLDRGQIGIHDNFFRLGGHSLKATTLIGRIHKIFSVEVPIGELFKKPTIEHLSGYINRTVGSLCASIRPVERREYYSVSSAQKRLFLVHQMETDNVTYNIPAAMVLDGRVERERLEHAFQQLINRHESLRTFFDTLDGEPVQKIHKEVNFKIEDCDAGRRVQGVGSKTIKGLSSSLHSAPCTVLYARIIKGLIRPFDLSQAPLLRVGLVKIEEQKHILVFDMHHIISDGVSMGVFTREFMTLYRGGTLRELPLQYKDFSLWQNGLMGSKEIKKQEAYWCGHLAGEIQPLNLPADHPRPAVQRFKGNKINFRIGEGGEAEKLERLALQTGSTLYMVLFAVFNLFLSKLNGQEDIVVGTPIAGRRHLDIENIIGMFVNILAVRTDTSGEKVFMDFLEEVRENLLMALENQDYQYEELVERLDIKRDLSRNPLYDTVFVLQNMEIRSVEIPGLTLSPLDYETQTSKFDLTLQCIETGEGLCFTFEYDTSLLEETTIRRFIDYYKTVIAEVLEDPRKRLPEIGIIPEEEKKQVLEEFNNTAREYPYDKTIQQLFEEQAEKVPDKIAVVHETDAMTYKELTRVTDRLADDLRERGVIEETVVGLMVGHSLEMVVGILAILKAGGTYLPIDPDYPEERINYILTDSNARALVSKVSWSCGEPAYLFPEVIDLNKIIEDIEHTLTHQLTPISSPTQASASSLAYIMYTSGSTGIPKGVMVEHRNVARLVKNTNFVAFGEEDRILQTGALEFDASTFEIWGALLNGLSLYLVNKGKIMTPRLLKEVMNKYDIATIWMTSSLFNQMLEADIEIFGGLKNLLVGGDVLSPSHINRIRHRFPALNVINGYGPTENTTFSCTYLIRRDFERSIPIGSPINNSTAYVVDKYGHLQPTGIWGELIVGGDGVARGYLNSPQLTASKIKRFDDFPVGVGKRGGLASLVVHPLHGDRLYRTGDMARWLQDGNIEFSGRIDYQVKIRGFRVELGEIENRLSKHGAVKEVVVLARADERGEKYLCAYVSPGTGVKTEELKTYLLQSLPHYMVPSYFVTLKRMPLNPNGKIDRKALPKPEMKESGEDDDYVPPRNDLEQRLVEIWRQLLAVEKIGIHDNFFDIGGHSLKALHLLNALQKEFHIKIDFQDIFQFPTIEELHDLIRESESAHYKEIEKQPEKEFYELSYSQKRLWLLYQFDPHDPAYNLSERTTLYEPVDENIVRKVFEKLVERHDAFRTSFKTVHGKCVQVIRPNRSSRAANRCLVNLETIDLSHLSDKEREKRREQVFEEESMIPFHLDTPPLFRTKLLKCSEEEFDVLLTMHHIITDGWSMEVLEREFALLYEAYKAGSDGHLHPLRIQYKDYVYWHNRLLLDKDEMRKAVEFWESWFRGERLVLDLPYDFSKSSLDSKESAGYRIVIPAKITASLRKIAKERKASLFMVLLAAFNLLMSRIAGQDDILLGVPGAARQHEDLKNIIGVFVNTLILRNKVNPDETFTTFLEKVQNMMLQVLEHQSYPLELICSEFKIRYPDISVFFNMSTFGNTLKENVKNDESYHIEQVQNAKFDIVSYVGEYKNGIEISTHYYKELFKPVTIEKMMQMYVVMLKNISDDPGKELRAYYKSSRKRTLKWN